MLIFTAAVQLLCQCTGGAAVLSFTPTRVKFDRALLISNTAQEIF